MRNEASVVASLSELRRIELERCEDERNARERAIAEAAERARAE